jgi:hypothetical protein
MDEYEKIEPNTRLISIGIIRTVHVTCPCCHSVYEVDLRADTSKGSSLVIIEDNTPVIHMNCDICGLHFKVGT